MKITQLRLKNLNSLYGDWCLDFTNEQFSEYGLFVLTGPTGSGKSTVLDAICLALYGATPRLGKISTRSNELMSRHCSECAAEVVFTSVSGSYRCCWQQRRKRRGKSETDPFAPAEHSISSATSGQIIASGISATLKKVEELTGMNFDRFTRSILLAQGAFDSFLTAETRQKSEILEQITGTEIYSQISKQVHERQSSAKKELEILLAGVAQPLEPEQRQQLQQQLESINKSRRQSQDQIKRVSLILDQARLVERWAKQLEQLNNEQRQVLGQLPGLETKLNDDAAMLQRASQSLLGTKAKLKQQQPLWDQVRQLDQQLKHQQQGIDAIKAEHDRAQQNKASNQQQLAELNKQRQQCAQQLQTIEQYQQQHQQDAQLTADLPLVNSQLSQHAQLQSQFDAQAEQINSLRQQLAQAEQKLQASQARLKQKDSELDNIAGQINQQQQNMAELLQGRDLREYQGDKDQLQQQLSLERKIASLESERERLLAGQPCPLCGALEHPYAQTTVPSPSATEAKLIELDKLLNIATKQQAAISKLEQLQTQAYQQRETMLRSSQGDELAKLEGENKLAASTTEHQQAQQAYKQLGSELAERLQAYQVNIDANTADRLRQRQQRWQQQQDQQQNLQAQLNAIATEIASCASLSKSIDTELARQQASLQDKTGQQQNLTEQRQELFADKNVEVEQQLLHSALEQGEQAEQEARLAQERSREALLRAQSRKADIATRLEQCQHELNAAKAQWQASLETTDLGSAADAQQQLELLQQQLDQQTETSGALQQRLQTDDQQQQTLQQQRQQIDRQRRECERWNKLHKLIGSADGKKYREFAQALSFANLVAYANQQLHKLSDRYVLVPARALALNVIDDYQGGEIRPTSNLSGGESFLISLSLALGLAQMASQKVRVDSLFLDEGFGTLDTDTLEVVLNSLSKIQQSGKLIGIITHVAELTQRIPTQININPTGGGKSIIEGPGCLRT